MHGNGVINSGTTTNMVATLFTSIIIERFGFNNLYYGILYGLAITVFEYLSNNFNISFIQNLGINFYVFILIGSVIIFVCYWSTNKIKNKYKDNYTTITIYDSSKISTIQKYMNYYPEFFKTGYDMDVGDLDLLLSTNNGRFNGSYDSYTMSCITSAKIDTAIEFNDTNLGYKGKLYWRKNKKEVKDKENNIVDAKVIKYLEICISKECEDIPEFINDMIKEVTELEMDRIVLMYGKMMPCEDTKTHTKHLQNHQVVFYKGKKLELAEKESIYMDTLFHHEKDRLWQLIKNIDLCAEKFKEFGQAARLNLLLYGPPGTGKSTFAYRIAMCLNRHILSLDIRDFTRSELYNILYHPNNYIEMNGSYQQVIFMFEEFDVGIKELYLRAKLKEKSVTHRFDTMHKAYSNYDGFSTKTKDVKNESDDEEEYSRDYRFDMKDLNLRDLLEVFQGPIPLDRMLIIATTNKYEEIKEMCPELFRAGRLSPVYFGYIYKETLQDISKYYFGKKLSIHIPELIKIPTSQIIELAMEAKLKTNGNYEFFRDRLQIMFDELS